MELAKFYIKNGVIKIKSHIITMRIWANEEHTDSDVMVDYCTDEELTEWTVNFVPKHKLWEVVSIETLDNSDCAWVEGLKLRTNNWKQELTDILNCGSIEAYEASLPEAQDLYNIELDYRLSKLELGI